MRKLLQNKRDNRGSAMVVVIVIIAFVSILISTLFTLSTVNIQMKSVDRKAKENFYSAEGALEQINMGLQNEISLASTDAYTHVMKNYSETSLEVQRRQKFNDKFLEDLEKAIYQDSAHTKYDVAKLANFLSDDVRTRTVLESTGNHEIIKYSDSLLLKGLVIKFTNDENFQSIIETDIRLTAPNMNLIQPGDMPDIFEYSIIANRGLEGSGSGNVTIGANVYAGPFMDPANPTTPLETALKLPAGAKWKFNQANRMVANGEVSIPNTAELKTDSEMDMWAKEFIVSGGTLGTKGRTYVSNDLLITDEYSNVKLEGEYYGFGNGITVNTDSSAILINGTHTNLDMSNIRKLMLAGSAQIATGDVSYDASMFPGGNFPSVKPEEDPSIDTLVDTAHPVVFANAKLDYVIESVGKHCYVRSEELALMANNPTDTADFTNSEAPERFVIVNNIDEQNSISFKDRLARKFVAVQDNGYGTLIANADKVSASTKFQVYPIKGMPGFYAIKCLANGKYVTVENYINGNGIAVTDEICATRDKVTDGMQLFKISHVGDAPEDIIEPPETLDSLVTFSRPNTSWIVVSLASPDWIDNKAEDAAEWIGSGPGATIKPGDEKKIWATISYLMQDEAGWNTYSKPIPMPLTNGAQRAMWIYQQGNGKDTMHYKITYTDRSGKVNTVEGTYNPLPAKPFDGIGNTSALDGSLANGVYIIARYSEAGKSATTPNLGRGALEFTAQNFQTLPDEDANSRFILTNYEDGTFSLRSVSEGAKYKYLSIQDDGTLKATASTVGKNERFIAKPMSQVFSSDKNGSMVVSTLPDSKGKGGYLCGADGGVIKVEAKPNNSVSNADDYKMYFQWIGYRSSHGPVSPEFVEPSDSPIVSMKYWTETSSYTKFTSPHWLDGDANQKVTMYYTVQDKNGNGKNQDGSLVAAGQPLPITKIDPMAIILDGATKRPTGVYEVPNLKNQDKVTYWFTYTYQDGGKAVVKGTPHYIYIHETLHRDPIELGGTNVNINLGESVEVKSNQIAYLVPEECIGVFGGDTIIGKNPMTQDEYARLMDNAGNTGKYPGFEIVSFTKEIEGMSKKLGDYHTPTASDPGYRKVFVPTTNGTMVYFYINFDSDNQAKYFKEYHEVHKNSLAEYMKEYVDRIDMDPDRMAVVQADGNLVRSVESGSDNVYKKPRYWADMNPAEQSALRSQEEGYQKRYFALTKKLIMDESEISPTERSRELFDNLIKFSEDPLDIDGKAFAGISPGTTPVSYWTDDHSVYAFVVNNMGEPAYHFKKDPLNPNDVTDKVCLIIATGDVVLEQDFSGIVIARGKVTINDVTVNNITGDREKLARILQTKINPTDPTSVRLIEHYFRDGDKYALEDSNSGANLGNGDYVPLNELVTYEGWTKR